MRAPKGLGLRGITAKEAFQRAFFENLLIYLLPGFAVRLLVYG